MTILPVQPHIGRYHLLFELGRGGMADVFLAVTHGPGGFSKLLVVKVLREHLARDSSFLTMFMDEARLAARVNHPNVVQTLEVGDEHGTHFLAMEYLDGQPLHRVIERARTSEQWTLGHSLRVLSEALLGLHHAHELRDFDGTPLSVVHRDVTPHNLFITYEGQIKLVDFGIAKANDSMHETRSDTLKGKIAYLSPEQANQTDVDRRADLFAAGLVLWELLSGKRLWVGVSDIAILKRLSEGDIPELRRELLPNNIPNAVVEICKKALSKNPEDRYTTAHEMHLAIEEIIESLGCHVSTKHVGDLVAQLFSAEREKQQLLVADRLGLLHEKHVKQESLPTAGAGDDTMVGRTDGDSLTSNNSLQTDISLVQHNPSAQSNSKPAVFVLAMAIVVAISVAFVLGRKDNTPTVPVSTTTATVTISIKVNPKDAKLTWDDQPLQENPAILHLPKDSATHTLRAEAVGYVSRVQSLVLDHDSMLDVMLEPVVQPPTAAASASNATTAEPNPVVSAKPPKSSVAVPQTSTATTAPPKLSLDPTNPYGK